MPPVGLASRLVREPIYHQLHHLLGELLRSGEFAPGQKFLTEREVAQRFGVSRVTANKALSHLVVTGALELRKGVGTFVRALPLAADLRHLVSFTRKAALSGQEPRTRVLALRTVKAGRAGERVAQALGAAPGEPLLYVERLRLADGVPVILERRHLVKRRCPGLTRPRLAGSLYAFLEDELGLRITGATQTVRALSLAETDAELLETEPGAATLWVHAVGYAETPLWVEDTLYRGDAYEFVNSFQMDESAVPAQPTLRRTALSPTIRREGDGGGGLRGHHEESQHGTRGPGGPRRRP